LPEVRVVIDRRIEAGMDRHDGEDPGRRSSPIKQNEQLLRNCRVPPNDRNLAHSCRSSLQT
jgi:hypothetical protein